jgi:hypothetical protein
VMFVELDGDQVREISLGLVGCPAPVRGW